MIIDTDNLQTVANYAHDKRISMRWVYDCLNKEEHPLKGIYIDGVRFVIKQDEEQHPAEAISQESETD